MKDVQNQNDTRNIGIRKVGVRDLRYPISVLDRKNKRQHTIAAINMYVDLPHHDRGTHMSRFVEVLERHTVKLWPSDLDEILCDMRKTFECDRAHINISFPYFIRKAAPVSGIESLMEYTCGLEAQRDGRLDMIFSVEVPVTNLCPCSKEISRYGAHNQRGIIKIKVHTRHFIWYEELIDIAESSASSPLFTTLKRVDEKYVTERAYENPRFVEDAAREVAQKLREDSRIDRFQVEVENFESIHNHNAYACITSDDVS
ncbi:MAG TPA: GTP cyclohydrolase I FolE2 [Sediminispirochaeta sp.]|nr:GTP cyclohydrolase I FolE2 [Sediminispirochaeta sp.]